MSQCIDCHEPKQQLRLVALLSGELSAEDSPYCCDECRLLRDLLNPAQDPIPEDKCNATIGYIMKQWQMPADECVEERIRTLLDRLGSGMSRTNMICTVHKLARTTPQSTTFQQFMDKMIAELVLQQEARLARV